MNKEQNSVFVDNLTVLTSPEGIQKYLMGTKKNGAPRAAWDIIKDVFDFDGGKKKKKHKNKHKKHKVSGYDFYVSAKKKKSKKHKKHWHI